MGKVKGKMSEETRQMLMKARKLINANKEQTEQLAAESPKQESKIPNRATRRKNKHFRALPIELQTGRKNVGD